MRSHHSQDDAQHESRDAGRSPAPSGARAAGPGRRRARRGRTGTGRGSAALVALLAAAFAGAPAPAQDAEGAREGADRSLEAGVVEGDPTEITEDDGLPKVALATFTTEISDREPVDDVTFLGSEKRVIYFFTDLRNMQGQTIRHVWRYEGMEMGTVSFDVKGARWRAWSSKQLLPAWLGEWTVSVLSPDDVVLATETFTYQEGS